MRGLLVMICGAMLLGACGGSGVGKGVRDDIQNQMASAETPMGQCYAEALERNDRLVGTITLSFMIQEKSGQFSNVQAASSSVDDQDMEQCVINKVSALKLQTPQKAKVAVDSYPVRFTPAN